MCVCLFVRSCIRNIRIQIVPPALGTHHPTTRFPVCAFHHRSTPLHWAAYEGHAMVVEALLAQGADVHASDSGGCGGRSVFSGTDGALDAV